MARQNVQARTGRKITTRQHKDGPEAQTWTDFEEDCDAVNQARASKISDSGYTLHISVFSEKAPTDGRCHFGMWRSRPRRSEPAADRRIGTRTVDDCDTPCPPSMFSLGPQTSLVTSPASRCETL